MKLNTINSDVHSFAATLRVAGEMCTERSPVGHWRHRLRNTGSAEAKRQQKKGHFTKTHFTPLEL